MFSDDDLQAYLLGVYRNGGNFNIYPQRGIPNWEVIYNHEFVHLVLAVSTTSGFIHQLFAYLGYQSPSNLKEHWQKLYKKSIELSQLTHESAATFISLCEAVNYMGDNKTFEDFRVSYQYKEWYYTLDRVVPIVLPVHLRIVIARAISSYAFNDPLISFKNTTWNEITDGKKAIKLLPKVDQRFNRLLAILKEKGEQFWIDILPKSFYKQVTPDSNEKTRDFLARRRNIASEIHSFLHDLLHEKFQEEIPVIKLNNDNLNKSSSLIQTRLKNIFYENRDRGLDSFSREYRDEPGEDPFLYEGVVLKPNNALNGLVKLPSYDILEQYKPGIVSVTQAVLDSKLSQNLIIKKGQYYTRYFMFEGNNRYPLTFYSITDEFPSYVWNLNKSTILIHLICEEAQKPENRLNRNNKNKLAVIYMDRISREFIDFVLSNPKEFKCASFGVPHIPGIYNVWIHAPQENLLWIADTTSTIANIFFEEAVEFNVGKLTEDKDFLDDLLPKISQVYNYVGISEGSPI